MKGSLDGFKSLYDEHRVLVILIYFVIYVVATSLSLPGAVVLTIVGGALFGFLTGTLIVSFASTIGATLACFVARFLLRDWVQGKFGDKIVKINEGIGKGGGILSLYLTFDPRVSFLDHQSGYGTHEDAAVDVLLGVTTWDARRHHGLCKCGERACQDRFFEGDSLARPPRFVCAPWDFSHSGKETLNPVSKKRKTVTVKNNSQTKGERYGTV